jgi:quercetin dioxygenase-like cupin family protein
MKRLKVFTYAAFFILYSSQGFSATVNPTPAPQRGIIPIVSQHYKTMPSFYDFDRMPAEQLTSKIKRRFILGTESSLLRWDLKAGTKLSVHFHVNEQITRVEKGILEVYSQGQKFVVNPGQVMVFPPNVPHEFIAVTDTVIYEQHTPARQDFINGEFDKKVSALAN